MHKVVTSLVGFKSVEDVANYAKMFPAMQYELSYKMDQDFLSAVHSYIQGKVASVHACCPALPIFPNFGSYDPQVLDQSYDAVRKSLQTAKQYGADILVLHPGYVTDASIPAGNKQRKILLDDPVFSPYVGKKEGSICKVDYPKQEVYKHHAKKAFEELVSVADLAASYNVRLAVENLNPRVGYLFQTPGEMIELACSSPNFYLCLDVGHLWISSAVYGFDYFQAIKAILQTNKVVNCHLHSNATSREYDVYSDDHHSFTKHSFPARQIISSLLDSEANLTLETIEELEKNTTELLDLLSSLREDCCGNT